MKRTKKAEWGAMPSEGGCISISIIRDYRIRSDRNYLEQANISPGVSPRRPERKNERGMGEEKATNGLVSAGHSYQLLSPSHAFICIAYFVKVLSA